LVAYSAQNLSQQALLSGFKILRMKKKTIFKLILHVNRKKVGLFKTAFLKHI